jgi:hypothetical protein
MLQLGHEETGDPEQQGHLAKQCCVQLRLKLTSAVTQRVAQP